MAYTHLFKFFCEINVNDISDDMSTQYMQINLVSCFVKSIKSYKQVGEQASFYFHLNVL
jgi:hypothetical protein